MPYQLRLEENVLLRHIESPPSFPKMSQNPFVRISLGNFPPASVCVGAASAAFKCEMLFFLPNIPDLRFAVSKLGLLAIGVDAPGLDGKLEKYDVGLPGE